MIFTKFKRFIAILLCVVVLGSFSLSAFAGSLSTLQYENINTIQESFIASFLSHCGIEVEFFCWDIDYRTDEFYDAAYFNLTRSFANYVFKQDSKIESKILEYASSSGLDSNIHGSSFVWQGNFKDSCQLVSQLVSHLYNFLSNYENMYGYCDVPISMYVGDYEEKFTGVWSRVTFLGLGHDIDTWYNNVGKSIQDYCIGDYVDDDFEGLFINYYWDYGPLPLGHQLYLDVLEDYIDDYNSPSGDSSGGSSDTPDIPDVPDIPSEDIELELLDFIKDFYRPFFLGLLSTYDIDFCRADFDFVDYDTEPAFLKASMLPIVDDLYSKIMGSSYSYYISNHYPTMKDDFLSVCSREKELFLSSSVYTFYPFDDYGGGCARRFFLGFFELFCSEFLDSRYFSKTDNLNIPRDQLHYGDSKLLLMFSVPVVDVPEDLHGTYTYWKDTYYYDAFIEFTVLCNFSIVPVVVYKDVDSYFDSWYFDGQHFFYNYFDEFDFTAYRLYIYNGYNIKHLLEKVLILGSSDSYNLLYYITNFFTNASSCFSFLYESFYLLPIEIHVCFIGGFIIIFAFSAIKLLL